MAYATASDGARIHYSAVGRRNAPPVLMIQGLGADFLSQVADVGLTKNLGPWSVNELRVGLTRPGMDPNCGPSSSKGIASDHTVP